MCSALGGTCMHVDTRYIRHVNTQYANQLTSGPMLLVHAVGNNSWA